MRDWSNAMGTPRSPEPVGTPTIHADPFDASNPDQLDADIITSIVALGKLRTIPGAFGQVSRNGL